MTAFDEVTEAYDDGRAHARRQLASEAIRRMRARIASWEEQRDCGALSFEVAQRWIDATNDAIGDMRRAMRATRKP